MQTEQAQAPEDWRARVLSDPELVLEDRDLMRALISANERLMGGNVVDMRGIAMERLEDRLERLEDTHRSVIAAAYENLAGTNQIHRAILAMLDQPDFESFLQALSGEIASGLRVDRVRLVLEATAAEEAADGSPQVQSLQHVLCIAAPGFVSEYISGGRNLPARPVTLRPAGDEAERVFGEDESWIRSEALMPIDLGAGRLPALLVLGSEDAQQFRPSQGTDLLTFFAAVFERLMRRWLG